jgi:hypothetical protein
MLGNETLHETHQSDLMGALRWHRHDGGLVLKGHVMQKLRDEQVMHGATQPKGRMDIYFGRYR